MAEYYPEDVLVTSRRLFEQLSAWGRRRDDVTLIGGWAVHELVKPGIAQQSRDVDLIMHTPEVLREFNALIPDLGLRWRSSGRNTFNDCHVIDDPKREIVVDVFKASDFPDGIFRGMRTRQGLMVKPWPERGFIPGLVPLLRDKVETIPNRRRDVPSKRLKDLLDIHALAFHNRAGAFPDRLAADVGAPSRLRALAHATAAITLDRAEGARFATELHDVQRWLST